MTNTETALRRHAIGIVTRLPENIDQARRVIELVVELLDFTNAEEPDPVRPVLTLVPRTED